MTTLSIRLDDRTARRLARRSADRGQTPEDLVRELVERVAALESLRETAERNAEALQQNGAATEDDVEALIAEGLRESRAARGGPADG